MVILSLMCKRDLLLAEVSSRSFFFFVLSDDVLQKIIEHDPKNGAIFCTFRVAFDLW